MDQNVHLTVTIWGVSFEGRTHLIGKWRHDEIIWRDGQRFEVRISVFIVILA